MSTLTMPNISIVFREAATTTIRRSQRGVVALLLRDAALKDKSFVLTSAKQIPATLGTENQAAVKRAFIGYSAPPSKVLLYVMDGTAAIDGASAALKWLATQHFNYLAGPADLTDAEAAVLKTWTLAQRSTNHDICKAVLPNVAGDDVGIINVTTNGSKVGTDTFDAAAYCGRIAGLLAGTPMTISATFAPLGEVEDVTRLTDEEMDTAVGAGKLLWFYDGEKVKLGRAVNSLTTLTGKSDQWKYIKIVDIIDTVDHDLRMAVADGYIGRYSNTYANKMLLVASIHEYLQSICDTGLIQPGFTCDIDVDAQEAWLQAQGRDTSAMSEQQIRTADTGTQVFLAVSMKPINAIEDVSLNMNL